MGRRVDRESAKGSDGDVKAPKAPTAFAIAEHPLRRSLLTAQLSSMRLRFEIFSSLDEYFAAFVADRPGCVVVDTHSVDSHSLLRSRFAAHGHAPPVVYITDDLDAALVVRVMKDRKVDILPRRSYGEAELWDAIQNAFARDVIDRAALERGRRRQTLLASLTNAEQDVLRLLIQGANNRQIATELGLTQAAVEGRRTRMMKKLGASNVIELIRLALNGDFKA